MSGGGICRGDIWIFLDFLFVFICLGKYVMIDYEKWIERGNSQMRFIFLTAIIGLKTLLCKGLALGILFLLFWIKGKQLRFNSDKWDDFFLSFPAAKAQKYAVWIYLAAAVISTAVCYLILELTGFQRSLGIAVLLFIGGLAITAYKWHTKGKDYLLNRYQEIPRTILEKREQEKEQK